MSDWVGCCLAAWGTLVASGSPMAMACDDDTRVLEPPPPHISRCFRMAVASCDVNEKVVNSSFGFQNGLLIRMKAFAGGGAACGRWTDIVGREREEVSEVTPLAWC